jgi:hypothetical protein
LPRRPCCCVMLRTNDRACPLKSNERLHTHIHTENTTAIWTKSAEKRRNTNLIRWPVRTLVTGVSSNEWSSLSAVVSASEASLPIPQHGGTYSERGKTAGIRAERERQINYVLLVSRQGKVRLAKWFTTMPTKQKSKVGLLSPFSLLLRCPANYLRVEPRCVDYQGRDAARTRSTDADVQRPRI